MRFATKKAIWDILTSFRFGFGVLQLGFKFLIVHGNAFSRIISISI